LLNRSGNRPSSEGAAEYLDRAAVLCRRGGFRKIKFRGDTDFTQTRHLDRWDEEGITFLFGIAEMANLREIAENQPEKSYRVLKRRLKYAVKTEPRRRRKNVKEAIVRRREFENIRLRKEHTAEFDYRPTNCRKTYRVVVLRKTLSVERGQRLLFPRIDYFFYITNDRKSSPAEIVFEANGRCDQENLIGQLKSGAHALMVPVDNLLSNWAYMVMGSLAWNLKAWAALLLPENGRWAKQHQEEKQKLLKMEFPTFLQAMIQIPAQVVRTGRRIVFRLLSWNAWQHVFFRLLDQLRLPMRC
jgi:hypothetical protein